ncbi:MAG TPA: Maf family protein [Clostridia bacterium]|nr:Maf family protein [Clostridia bacterium]
MRLILASGSARRRELLELMGYDFTTCVTGADEDIPLCAPGEYVEKLALLKAREVFAKNPDACVVGCDTIVCLEGEIIGKPRDEEDAFRILKRLAGRAHVVYTGVAVLAGEREIVFSDETKVIFNRLSDAELRAYITTGEPLDKAGAYGIQGPGSFLVERVEGCYFTVMGLPNPHVYKALREVGVLPRWMR